MIFERFSKKAPKILVLVFGFFFSKNNLLYCPKPIQYYIAYFDPIELFFYPQAQYEKQGFTSLVNLLIRCGMSIVKEYFYVLILFYV